MDSEPTKQPQRPVQDNDALLSKHWAKLIQIINWFFAVIVGLIAIRVILRLFNAVEVGFALLIFRLTDPLVAPFRIVFPPDLFYELVAGLLAIVVYVLVNLAIVRLVMIIGR